MLCGGNQREVARISLLLGSFNTLRAGVEVGSNLRCPIKKHHSQGTKDSITS